MQDLEKLFWGELADIYHAEKQLVKALPKMMKACNSEMLKGAFEEHLDETKGHVERIEKIFSQAGKPAKAKTCRGMEGLVDEGEEIAGDFKGNSALDPGLICAAQKVEHYEIASYGSLCTWAEELGMRDALQLLKSTMQEEKTADEKLTDIAENHLNLEAAGQATEGGTSRARTTTTAAARTRRTTATSRR